MRQLNMLQHI